MKGIDWILVLIIGVIISGCVQSIQTTPSIYQEAGKTADLQSMITYENSQLGFKIDYPEGYMISPEQEYVAISSPEDRNPLLVFVSTFESKDDLNTMTQEFKRLEREASDNFNLIDENVHQINGEQATVHTYTKTPSTPREKEIYTENSVLQTTVVITIHESRGYRLVFTAARAGVDKWVIVQSMMNSFEFRTIKSIPAASRVKRGEVTVETLGTGSYYLGDKIEITGVNTDSNKLYLFLVGSKLPTSGGKLQNPITSANSDIPDTFTVVDVQNQNIWNYSWETNNIGLGAGTYTIYAVSQPLNKNDLINARYATCSIILKKPLPSPLPK